VDTEDRAEIANLERVNSELTASFGLCRAILEDCKSKLTANTNEPYVLHEDVSGAEDVLCSRP
jgi:hypothetical protein